MRAVRSVIRVRALARRFRRALASCSTGLGPAFERFPEGSCGDAALLLGRYLLDEGAGAFDYVSGTRGSMAQSDWTSHAWLEGAGLIVDVTADQFADGANPIVVARRSLFHSTFAVDIRHAADFRLYDSHTAATLEGMYQHVRAALARQADA